MVAWDTEERVQCESRALFHQGGPQHLSCTNNDLLHAALPLETVTKSGTYVSKLYLKIQAERVTI